MIETTLFIYDKELYKELTPNCVMETLRVMVANRLATNGAEWTNIFKDYNRCGFKISHELFLNPRLSVAFTSYPILLLNIWIGCLIVIVLATLELFGTHSY